LNDAHAKEIARRDSLEAPLGMDATALAADVKRYFGLALGRDEPGKSRYYLYRALASAVRDRMVERWQDTRDGHQLRAPKRVAYLSMEFLMGRALHNAIMNLSLDDSVRTALQRYACELEEVEQEELDAGLGNGGLGRLAACFLDSCATLNLPVTGYGLRYEYGMFHQRIENGYQIEAPDRWLRDGSPWEIESPENACTVKFFGRSEAYADALGVRRMRWVDTRDVLAIPYDVPIPGYRNNIVNTLRLWKAEATDEFDLAEFNAGSYTDAVAAKNAAEQITMVLYPNDASENGKSLRLRQQYFLASASLQDMLHRWTRSHGDDFAEFAQKHCFQLNDTHPTVAIPELMRLLMDEHYLSWDKAWSITIQTIAYTNHTLLPEALERWPVALMRELLPRILDIIYEINARFLSRVAERWPGDVERQRRMSIIEEDGQPQVRMAYLAIVGSFSVNGVAALHTRLLTEGLFRDFYELFPQRFNNKTNGVSPRRWLAHCNPELRQLISSRLGEDWVVDASRLEALLPLADDERFRARWRDVKLHNKQRLVRLVKRQAGVEFDSEMLFDVQVKRIHEYKRQLLNVLHVIYLYERILRGDTAGLQPRCVLLGGKAAPGYLMAKLLIKLIHNVADAVNRTPACRPWLRVAFLPDYGVTAMESICPGTDLSEQISTAGKEASGTGNMKFMMNGALTVGTLDGANIEILDAVGSDAFFLFGLSAEQLQAQREVYAPDSLIAADADLQRVMHLLESCHFNMFESGLFAPVIGALRNPADPWMVLADFRSYIDAQAKVDACYRDSERWVRLSIRNTALSGRFSSDRTISEYDRDIWHRRQ
jgi:starch phosphorylase